jgi:hypothetical protein
LVGIGEANDFGHVINALRHQLGLMISETTLKICGGSVKI